MLRSCHDGDGSFFADISQGLVSISARKCLKLAEDGGIL